MNETIKLLHTRASCRAFADRPIPPEVLDAVLEAGVRAPTGGNLQPYSIITVRNRAVASKLASLCGDQPFIARAPVNLLFCIDFHRGRRWAELSDAPFTCNRAFRHFWIAFQDTIIAAQNICVAADSAGLGSCYVGTVLECFPELRSMFQLPQGVFPVVLLSLGYPDAELRRRGKFPQSIIVHDEVYHDPSDEQLSAGLETKYQGKTLEATDSRIEELARVCTAVGGPELARRAVERVRRDGAINMAQYYFGLHYKADAMPERNPKFIAQLRDAGIEIVEDGR
ncbi:MAG: FMN reductase (NAD(P)H) [Firmicutes bacterium ADurb.Bin506]|jgi:nitroreductase|nr:MAG: FMN reductase (NAD(P)H) [Firmicutes bacterium ADurb.Bin506]